MELLETSVPTSASPRATLGLVRIADIKELELPANIADEAIAVHQSLSKSALCSQKKKHVLCYVVYMAHMRAKEYQDTSYYERVFDIRPRALAHINASMGIAIKKHPKAGVVDHRQPVTTFTCSELLSVYCARFSALAPSHRPKVQELLEKLFVQDSTLKIVFPQKLAAAVIVLYMETKGVAINDQQFVKTIGVKDYLSVLKRLRKLMGELQ